MGLIQNTNNVFPPKYENNTWSQGVIIGFPSMTASIESYKCPLIILLRISSLDFFLSFFSCFPSFLLSSANSPNPTSSFALAPVLGTGETEMNEIQTLSFLKAQWERLANNPKGVWQALAWTDLCYCPLKKIRNIQNSVRKSCVCLKYWRSGSKEASQ